MRPIAVMGVVDTLGQSRCQGLRAYSPNIYIVIDFQNGHQQSLARWPKRDVLTVAVNVTKGCPIFQSFTQFGTGNKPWKHSYL